MNGMHQEQHWAYNLGSNDFTASHDFELPPTPTLAQVTLGDFMSSTTNPTPNLALRVASSSMPLG